ncbi:hypothetical protein GN956_G24964 [Arapaima gigas]
MEIKGLEPSIPLLEDPGGLVPTHFKAIIVPQRAAALNRETKMNFMWDCQQPADLTYVLLGPYKTVPNGGRI